MVEPGKFPEWSRPETYPAHWDGLEITDLAAQALRVTSLGAALVTHGIDPVILGDDYGFSSYPICGERCNPTQLQHQRLV